MRFIQSIVIVPFSFSAMAHLHDNLVFQAVPFSEGTVLIRGISKYEKTFNIVVYSNIDQPIELTNTFGC